MSNNIIYKEISLINNDTNEKITSEIRWNRSLGSYEEIWHDSYNSCGDQVLSEIFEKLGWWMFSILLRNSSSITEFQCEAMSICERFLPSCRIEVKDISKKYENTQFNYR